MVSQKILGALNEAKGLEREVRKESDRLAEVHEELKRIKKDGLDLEYDITLSQEELVARQKRFLEEDQEYNQASDRREASLREQARELEARLYKPIYPLN